MSTRGAYQTRQQDAVMRLFHLHPDKCLSAEEVFRLLLDEGLTLGKTTVYRSLTRLCENGVLRRYAPQQSGESARYQFNPCKESHLHIRCTHCGALEHLHCGELEAFKQHISLHHGFVLNEQQTMLFGLCQGCSKKEQTR